VYDFVENCEEAEMKNQMAAYQTLMKHYDRPFGGTIIRVPLRTQAQAEKSEIVKRATTTPELVDVIKTFASDFGHNGLLFMRNIEKLELRAPGVAVEIEMLDRDKLRL
jgi:sacsin